MPEIVVMTDVPGKPHSEVVYRERIASSDLDSDHYSTQLLERVGWAVQDVHLRIRDQRTAERTVGSPVRELRPQAFVPGAERV